MLCMHTLMGGLSNADGPMAQLLYCWFLDRLRSLTHDLSNLMPIVGYDVSIVVYLRQVFKEGIEPLDKILGFICVCFYVYLGFLLEA